MKKTVTNTDNVTLVRDIAIKENALLIAINCETVKITPVRGNWNGPEIYNHLTLAGFDLDDDNLFYAVLEGKEGYCNYFRWQYDGAIVEAWIPESIYRLVEPEFLNGNDIIDKLERQTESVPAPGYKELTEEELEAKRKRNEGRNPEDLEF